MVDVEEFMDAHDQSSLSREESGMDVVMKTPVSSAM